MERILIIGSPGSGKSTFARKLQKKLNLPLFYLDMLWHKADRTTFSNEEFDGKLQKILETDRWIIDGNYTRTLERRLSFADAVIFFNVPTQLCLDGIFARVNERREDMPWVEERVDEAFYDYVLNFKETQHPRILSIFEKFPDIKITVFTSRSEAEDFLSKL